MPFYEYKCQECSYQLETMQGINDSPLTTCSECGGLLQRIVFPPQVIYKGKGFYATENRKGDQKPEGIEKVVDEKKNKDKDTEL